MSFKIDICHQFFGIVNYRGKFRKGAADFRAPETGAAL
jgi:predicted aminopeptidase